ncbi:MAG: Gfo/Idh/MocA family oxidoreductase [Deltaproteobacteria bacterium]|nr:Gfo/Idh/MocA family oxidoreductase [Deltaproteobacteria bacterium]
MRMGVRAAVVGAGYWGANLIRALNSTDGIWLKLVCDRRSEALQAVKKRYPQVALTASWESVLCDQSLDAIILATPPATHYQLACAALAAGKHTWVEKPLALHYLEGQELVALAREADLALFVDETFLYDPLVQRARALIAAGSLGKVYHVSLERTGMGRIRRDSNVWWNSAPHDLAILRYLLDAPALRISATGQAYVQPGIEDVVWAAVQLEGNVFAHVYLNWLFPEKKAPLMVVGETGMIGYEGRFTQRALTRYGYRLGQIVPLTPEELSRANLIPIERSEIVEVIRGDRTEPLLQACAAFRDNILSGEPAPSSGACSLHTLAVLEAGARSLAQHGAWVEVVKS